MIKVYTDLVQGTDEWLKVRCGMLTASTMKQIFTPTMKLANNKETKSFLHEIVAQRALQYVEPVFENDFMLKGHEGEMDARMKYSEHFAQVKQVGFITNDRWGYTLGYSPDGLVGDDGCIEVKTRMQKHQMATILADAVPEEYLVQLQTGLLVSERKWCDFISYCGGMPMFIKRVYADENMQQQILAAAQNFESQADQLVKRYKQLTEGDNVINTERTTSELEIF